MQLLIKKPNSVSEKDFDNGQNKLIKSIHDIAESSSAVRVDKTAGYRGSKRIVYIGIVSNNSIKDAYTAKLPEAATAKNQLQNYVRKIAANDKNKLVFSILADKLDKIILR
jgi:hypothetical protein